MTPALRLLAHVVCPVAVNCAAEILLIVGTLVACIVYVIWLLARLAFVILRGYAKKLAAQSQPPQSALNQAADFPLTAQAPK